MSSLVHAKWTSSARPASCEPGATSASRFLTKYSTALTSCWVTRSVCGQLGDLVGAEGLDGRAERGPLLVGQPPDAGDDLVVGEVDEPLDLDMDPGPVERGLGEVVDERGDDRPVPAVEGAQRDGGDRVGKGLHGLILPEG